MRYFLVSLFCASSLLAQVPLQMSLPKAVALTTGSAVAAFNPNDLSPILWVDIDSNILNHAGSAPVNNDTIKQWTDCSANARNLTQLGGTTLEPVYHTTGGPNSGPYIDFVGGTVGRDLTNRNVSSTFTQPNSYYFVVNFDSGDKGFLNGAADQNNQIANTAANGMHWYAGNDVVIGNRFNGQSVGVFGIVSFEFNTTSSMTYTNNIVCTSGSSIGSLNPMAGITIGALFNGTEPSGMKITDLLWLNSVLSAANRTNVFRWLSTKRRITLP